MYSNSDNLTVTPEEKNDSNVPSHNYSGTQLNELRSKRDSWSV